MATEIESKAGATRAQQSPEAIAPQSSRPVPPAAYKEFIGAEIYLSPAHIEQLRVLGGGDFDKGVNRLVDNCFAGKESATLADDSQPAQPPESPRLAWSVANGFYEDLARYLRQARAIVDLIGRVDPQHTKGITFQMASSAAGDLIELAGELAEQWLNASRGVPKEAAEANHG